MGIGTSGRLLFAAFALVVASFVASQLVQQYASRDVDESSDAIVRIASPSISYLANLRGDTRHVEFLLDAWVDAAADGRPIPSTELDNAMARFSESERAYVALPRFQGEDPLWLDIQSATLRFVRSAQRAISEVENGNPRKAQQTVAKLVDGAATDLNDAAYGAIEFHAKRGAELAEHIKEDRHRALMVGWILDGACAVFAIVAATVLWRILRRNEQLREDYARLLERRAAELESFSGRVAHDILSPLGAARLALELASRMSEGRAQELLSRSLRALSRVENLTDDLLAFARAGARPAAGARAEVRPVIEGVVDELREQVAEARVDLVVQPLPAATVGCSTGILTSLVSNLVRNALKYMGDSLERIVTIRVVRHDGRWRFEVADTGPGIPPDMAQRLFEPYVRGPSSGVPGLGLGLATVKRLAESHGGRVGVESEPGRGTLFWFELPEAGPAPAAEETPAPLTH